MSNEKTKHDERVEHGLRMIESGRNTLAVVELLAELLDVVERVEAKLDKTGTVDVEEPVKRGPGRPRKTDPKP